MLSRPAEPPRRARLLFAAVLIVYTAIFASRGVKGPGPADGFYAFLYARSLAFDHDLDFANDYALCGDPWRQGIDRGTGRADNPGHPGPALVWTPFLVIGRALVPVPADAPEREKNGCAGKLATFALSSSMPLGALAIALAYRTARRFARPTAAMAASLLFAFASSLPQYAAVFVSSSHVHECFAAALLVWLTVRALERSADGEDRRPAPARPAGLDVRALQRWWLVGAALGLCALQRLPGVCLGFVPLAMLAGADASRTFKAKAAVRVVAGGAVGIGLMLLLYAHLYGSPFVLPQGRHYVHLAHAHPWLLLFGPHGGLFFTTPIVWLGIAGIAVAVASRRHRHLGLGVLLAFVVCLWISSSPLDWHGKATFGARRLLVLTPLFVVMAAIALDACAAFARRHAGRLLVLSALVIFGVPVLGGALGTTTGETSLEGGTQAATYGGGVASFFRVIDGSVGDLAILPGEAFYAWRFRLPMRTFRAATTDRHYRRSYRDLTWEPNALDFRDATLREASAGMRSHDRGMALAAADARVVFTAGWPHATRGSIALASDRPTTLRIALNRTFGTCDLGEHHADVGHVSLGFAIPAGCFDSGLLELALHVEPAPSGAGVVVERVVFDDDHAYEPPY